MDNEWIPLCGAWRPSAVPPAANADDPPTPAEAVAGHVTRVDSDPGHGETEEAANEEARKKACAWFQSYLDYRYGDIGWKPEPDELVREGVVRLDAPQAMKPARTSSGATRWPPTSI